MSSLSILSMTSCILWIFYSTHAHRYTLILNSYDFILFLLMLTTHICWYIFIVYYIIAVVRTFCVGCSEWSLSCTDKSKYMLIVRYSEDIQTFWYMHKLYCRILCVIHSNTCLCMFIWLFWIYFILWYWSLIEKSRNLCTCACENIIGA